MSNFITKELLVTILTATFAFGAGYTTLAIGQSENEKQIEENKRKIEAKSDSLHKIEMGTSVLINEQKHLDRKMTDILKQLERLQ